MEKFAGMDLTDPTLIPTQHWHSTNYFKTHYPAIFFQVMLNYSSSDYIVDALQMGFESS